jgi:D-alanyl-D-alanine carboxypeptidase (penicillin-binding protein 5/6)
LRAGEVFTVEELLEGALLKSGNDATVALAEAVSGEMEEFVALMNQRAETLGAANSSFANPHGLTAPNHYSSAFDLALFANFALGIPTFREFVAKREGKIGQEGGEWVRKLKNTNRLLWAFPGADGVKTGTTNRAGPCLVSSATRDGRQLICVVLMSYNRWRDASLLLEYGFNNFKLHQVAKKGEVVARSQVEEGKRNQVELVASDDLELVVRTEEANLVKTSIRADKLSAPVARHQEAGTISAELDQVELGRVSLLTRTSVPRQSLWEQLKKKFW